MARSTTDHHEIRTWANARNAVPAETPAEQQDGPPSILRFIFADSAKQSDLRPISWEDFFAKFDLLKLSFAYPNGLEGGSRAYELVLMEPTASEESEKVQPSCASTDV